MLYLIGVKRTPFLKKFLLLHQSKQPIQKYLHKTIAQLFIPSTLFATNEIKDIVIHVYFYINRL